MQDSERVSAYDALKGRVHHPEAKPGPNFRRSSRLLKHSDFERVYKQGRRLFSAHMTVFYLRRADADSSAAVRPVGPTVPMGPRVGFTVGRVLGGAVDRNRIKRRLREAVRLSRSALEYPVDVVINPKKSTLTVEFKVMLDEVRRALDLIAKKMVEN